MGSVAAIRLEHEEVHLPDDVETLVIDKLYTMRMFADLLRNMDKREIHLRPGTALAASVEIENWAEELEQVLGLEGMA